MNVDQKIDELNIIELGISFNELYKHMGRFNHNL